MIKINIRKSEKCADATSIFVSFPYDKLLVDMIKSFPIKYWNNDNKEWELPTSTLEEVISKFNNYAIDIQADASELIRLMNVNYELPTEFEYKTKPFEHQKVGFDYGLTHDRWLLGDEQGLGKTKQVIDIGVAKKYQRGYKHCLIICGVNGLKWNWCNEVRTHSDEDAYILGQKVLKNGKMKIGSNEDKLNDLINFDDIKEYFIITNIETLRYKEWTGEYIKSRNGKVSKEYRYPITDRLVELCNSHDIDMIATDEVHKMKNSESDQGSQFLRLHAETMIAMTGTPLMNQPMDLFIILKWLGFESHSFYAFRNYYCNLGGFSGYEIMGYKNLDDLQARLDKIMLRRKKEDVLDLPEKTYINEYVEMTPKQSQVYKEVTMDIKANIDQVKAAANPLSALIRMRQATGYTGILSSVVKESAKLDRMEELVEESRANGKKVVIFSNWTQMTDVIYDRLNSKGYGISVITGDTKDEDRQQIVDLFQNSPKCNVLIGTIGAMGTGLTLTAGTVEIFMDEPWNRALKDQAEDRCHRIGQNSNITIYTLLCKDTIDERINQLVYKKGKMSDALVDGEIKFNKSDIIDFLLD